MRILVDRRWKKDGYTIGKLYLDGIPFCETLEDRDRGLRSSMPPEEIKSLKKAGTTAIPTGTYRIRMDVVSGKYSRSEWYIKNCHGAKVPRLEDVPGYAGILIHSGNTAEDTEGCILVGRNKAVGKVLDSKETFLQLYGRMYAAYSKGEGIEITIE